MKQAISKFLSGFLFVALVTSAPTPRAHLPQLYGKEFVRVDIQAAPEPIDREERPVPPTADGKLYQALLTGVERAGGAYAPGLADPLSDIAYFLEAQGKIDDAVRAYRRALHVIRINDGLYSEQQIPILRRLVVLYRSAGDYESLGKLYQYYHRVGELAAPPATLEQVTARLEYLDWERALFLARPEGAASVHLLRALQANDEMLAAFLPRSPEELEWYIRLALSQVGNYYLLLGEEQIVRAASGFSSGDGAASDAVNRQLAMLQVMAFGKGRILLERCLELSLNSGPDERAALHLELGDWLLWNNQLERAGRQYATVFEILQNAGKQALAIEWLGQPTEIPDEKDFWSGFAEGEVPAAAIVEARFDVSARGSLKNLEVSVESGDDRGQAIRIKRMLRETHFRPRFTADGPEAVEQILRRYRLTEPER